jgi:hypothetical protein
MLSGDRLHLRTSRSKKLHVGNPAEDFAHQYRPMSIPAGFSGN